MQRKQHYDYRVRLLDGALQVADLYTKWSMHENTLKDSKYNEDAARADQEAFLTSVESPS